MTAFSLVQRLLETQDDPDADMDRYLGYVHTGTPEEALQDLGFVKDREDWYTRIPLHTKFESTWGMRYDKEEDTSQLKQSVFTVTIRVEPAFNFYNGECHRCRDPHSLATRRWVDFQVGGFYVGYGRTCIQGTKGSLAGRLTAVIKALFEAIERADKENHKAVYKFCGAVNRYWGAQSNRMTTRKASGRG